MTSIETQRTVGDLSPGTTTSAEQPATSAARRCSRSTPSSDRCPVSISISPQPSSPSACAPCAPPIAQQLVGREDAAAAVLTPRDALELAQLLERVDPHVRVGADAERDPAVADAGRPGESRLRGPPRSSGSAQIVEPLSRSRSSSAPSACVAWTTVVRSPRQPRPRAARSAGMPCSARHSSISRGCSSAWTCRTSSSRVGVAADLLEPVARARADGVGGEPDARPRARAGARPRPGTRRRSPDACARARRRAYATWRQTSSSPAAAAASAAANASRARGSGTRRRP